MTPRDEKGAAVNYQETSMQQLYKMVRGERSRDREREMEKERERRD